MTLRPEGYGVGVTAFRGSASSDSGGGRIPVFVLGVPGRYRGTVLEQDLNARGFPAERLDAPDATLWTSDDVTRVYDSVASRIVMYREMTPPEIACAVGHRQFVRRKAEDDDEWAILLEDDTRIVGDLAELVPLLAHLSGRRAVVLLGDATFPDPEILESLSIGAITAVRLKSAPWGSWAYAMSREAARHARRREHGLRVSSTSDWPLIWSTSTEFWRCSPSVVQHPQGDAGSLLEAQRAASLRSIRERRLGRRIIVAGLRLSGALAAVARARGLPFWALWARDWRAFTRRMRRRWTDRVIRLRAA